MSRVTASWTSVEVAEASNWIMVPRASRRHPPNLTPASRDATRNFSCSTSGSSLSAAKQRTSSRRWSGGVETCQLHSFSHNADPSLPDTFPMASCIKLKSCLVLMFYLQWRIHINPIPDQVPYMPQTATTPPDFGMS